MFRHPLLGIVLGEAEIGSTWSDESARKKLWKRACDRFSDLSFAFVDFILLIIYPIDLVEDLARYAESKIVSKLRESRIGAGLAYRTPSDGAAKTKMMWHPEPIHPTELPSILETLAQSALKEVFGTVFKPEDLVGEIIRLIERAATHAKELAKIDKQWLNFWEQVAKKFEIDVEILCDKSEGAYLAAKTLYTLITIATMIYETARARYPTDLKAIDRPLNFHRLAKALDDLRKVNYLEIVDMITDTLTSIPMESTLEKLSTRFTA